MKIILSSTKSCAESEAKTNLHINDMKLIHECEISVIYQKIIGIDIVLSKKWLPICDHAGFPFWNNHGIIRVFSFSVQEKDVDDLIEDEPLYSEHIDIVLDKEDIKFGFDPKRDRFNVFSKQDKCNVYCLNIPFKEEYAAAQKIISLKANST